MKRLTVLSLLLALVAGLYATTQAANPPEPSLRLNDLGAISIIGNLTPAVGQQAYYTVLLHNFGSTLQADYQVKLMGPDDTVLASVTGLPISSHSTTDVAIPWTPTIAGETAIYGKVELAGDQAPQNDQTSPLAVSVQSEGIHAVTIGSGNEQAHIPMDFSFRNSLYQTLYYPNELGFTTGIIDSLAFYNQFSTAVPGSATKVFLGSTGQNDLSRGYIPASQLTLVYDGNIDYPAGENTIIINLQTPYIHTSGNLVLMVQRPMDTTGHSPDNRFKCQLRGFIRARNSYHNNTVLNPYNPPEGYPTGTFPCTTFYFSEQVVENDLFAISVTGDLTPSVGVGTSYVVRIKNNGTNAQDNYTVKLKDSNHVELASLSGPAISSQQILDLELTWTPTLAGFMSIYAEVVLAGDEIPANNQTPLLDLAVYPTGEESITVGEGGETARIPVDMYYRYSLFQTLYYSHELQGFIGQITGLRFYNEFNSNVMNMPISIWLGTTTQNNLAEGFIPSTQLTLVYEGPVDFPSGQNTIAIDFDQPFSYLDGQNLVMMVYKTANDYYSIHDNFRCQTSGTDRSIIATSDSQNCDPANPPPGTSSGQFPATIFKVTPALVGQICGTVSSDDGTPIPDASVSNGTVATTTNAVGVYTLVVPIGYHNVSASAAGFDPLSVENVLVSQGQTTTVDFILGAVSSDDSALPVAVTMLYGNYPNPFNPETTVSYSIKEPGRVKLEVYNIKGQLVRTLVDEEHAAGLFKQVFSSKDDRGRSISSGVYLLRMTAPGYRNTTKMMLMQ